jgi:uncharacterized membrane protein
MLWTGSTVAGWLNLAGIALVLAGLVAGWTVWASPRPPGRVSQALVMASLVAGLLGWGYLRLLIEPAYGTDSIAFNQYAAELLLQGKNPYAHSMLPSLEEFQVPPIHQTYLLDGTVVDDLSYPALSFLLYLPALVLGLNMQAAVVTDLVAWAIAFLLLWRLLPGGAAWAAALLMTFTIYVSFVVGGVTDSLFLPFVFLAVWRWDRFGDPTERGAARWIGPVALGLAMCVKKTPWFLFPFLLVGVAREAHLQGARWPGRIARYTGIALGVFLAINAPFIAADPLEWLRGVVVPLASPTVPGGEGLVNLGLLHHIGGNLDLYAVTGALAAMTALTAFGLYYAQLKRAWIPLVALVFFWPTRSFASYLIELIPAALLAGVTVRAVLPEAPKRLLRIAKGSALAVPAALFLVSLTLTLAARPPLEIEIVTTRSTGQLGTISGIDLRVTNTSDRALEPHFTIQKAGFLTTFWYPLEGDAPGTTGVIPPHDTRRIFLRAPNSQSMPALTGGYIVQAFTDDPATVSSSELVPPPRSRLVLSPSAINSPVPAGSPVRLTVKLVDEFGERARRPGVQVALGQVVYSQENLFAGETSINGLPVGQSPVLSRTNASGEAVFVVRGVRAQADPVFFQAWIGPRSGIPHGYSNLVSVQFTTSRA